MKYLIGLMLFLVVSCSPRATYTSLRTTDYAHAVDSISNANGLNISSDINVWVKTFYVTDDSVVTNVYVATEKNGKATHIISVLGCSEDSIYTIRHRIEK